MHARRANRRRLVPAAAWAAIVLVSVLFLPGCQGASSTWMGDTDFADPRPATRDRPPRWRRDGPRLPAFSGADPTARGWVKVDDLLWIDAEHQSAYGQGLVSDGQAYVPVGRALPPSVSARNGYRLRTDHVALHTNVAWASAVTIAREAEGHVQRLVGQYGDTLGLRLPHGPLRVVVTASRAEFTALLRGLVRDPVSWGAFYDARTGIVYTSFEAAPRGALPWRADLRHEMSHQILDLSRPDTRRARPFPEPWFWLWEGIAMWTETLGDPPGTDTGAARIERFQRRYAWNDWTPLERLFRLPPRRFEGKHYDQTASLMRYLLDPAAPARRGAVLDLVRRLMKGPLSAGALERALGTNVAGLQQAWVATVGR